MLAGFAGFAAYYYRPFSHRLAAYVTDLTDRSPAQRENILRVSTLIDGKIIKQGEVFSLNSAAGPYTEERGFVPERSIQGKRVIYSPGGGVCQVASTLYNSAYQAGLDIIERVPHSQRVQSVPQGWDATISYAWADLKFRNNQPYPIKIVAREVRNQLLLEIWGQEVRHE